MQYKAIAFDLDGTLLSSQGTILPSSKNAIKLAQQEGLKVMLVTGRHHTAVKPYYYELDLDTPVICCNGTYIYDFKTNTVPVANPLSHQQAEKLIQVAQQYNLDLLLYSRDAMNYSRLNPHMEKFLTWVNQCSVSVRPDVRQINDFQSLLNAENIIWKGVISHSNRKIMEAASANLSPEEFNCEWSWIDRIDVANKGNSKGGRLLEQLAHWQISASETIAFGDNHNDTSMLTAVGLGVAMGNAEQEVKQQADLVTLSNDENGIEKVLMEYL